MPTSTVTILTAFFRYTVWPDDALRSVAEQSLLPLELGPSIEGALAEQCMRFHKTARQMSER
jgi:dynein heavy chain